MPPHFTYSYSDTENSLCKGNKQELIFVFSVMTINLVCFGIFLELVLSHFVKKCFSFFFSISRFCNFFERRVASSIY